jgi:hypothetical protein
MSQDFLLTAYCPHEILNEKVSFQTKDRRLLTLQNPIEDRRSVKVYFNGEIIPPHGKEIPASVIGINSSPFNLNNCTLVFLKYTLKDHPPTSTFSVSLARGYYSAVDLSQKINKAINNNFIQASNRSGFLELRDSSGNMGLNSLIRVTSDQETLKVLGLTDDLLQGSQLFPGWDAMLMGDQLPSVIRFKGPVQATPKIEVCYATYSWVCPRCMTSGVENDITFDSYGEPVLITDEKLLYQMCLKAILTKYGSNPYHSWYGSGLDSFIGSKSVDSVVPLLKEEIKKNIETLQNIQRQQRLNQKVTAAETIYRIVDLDVIIDPDNPQIFNINVTLMSSSMELVPINIVYANSSSVSRS